MTTEQLDYVVTTSRWDRLPLSGRMALILALIVPVITVVLADADPIRYGAAGAVLVMALVFGWVRETDGLTVPVI